MFLFLYGNFTNDKFYILNMNLTTMSNDNSYFQDGRTALWDTRQTKPAIVIGEIYTVNSRYKIRIECIFIVHIVKILKCYKAIKSTYLKAQCMTKESHRYFYLIIYIFI